MLINGKLAQLGKKAATRDPRNLKLARYIQKIQAPAPPEVSWITKLTAAQSLPMYLNDKLGDCVAAAAGHMIQQWNFYAGHPAQPTDDQILKSYEDVGGYAPGNPSTDNGMDMAAYLKYWATTGVGGHVIGAYLAVDYTNVDEVRQAIELFGNIYLGVQLPTSAQGASGWTMTDGGIYAPAGSPGGWGGHCIPLVASSPETHTCITWGASLKMSHNFLANYADEAFVILSKDWIEVEGVAPSGFDLAQLQADLAAL